MNTLNKIKGSLWSKTSNTALVVMVIGGLEQFAPQLLNLGAAEYRGLFTSLLGVLFWVLRWVTTQPLDKK